MTPKTKTLAMPPSDFEERVHAACDAECNSLFVRYRRVYVHSWACLQSLLHKAMMWQSTMRA